MPFIISRTNRSISRIQEQQLKICLDKAEQFLYRLRYATIVEVAPRRIMMNCCE